MLRRNLSLSNISGKFACNKFLKRLDTTRTFCSSINNKFGSITQSDIQLLDEYKALPLTTIIDALWTLNYPQSQLNGLQKMTDDNNIAIGYATTLRFVPFRPDIITTYKAGGSNSPEY